MPLSLHNLHPYKRKTKRRVGRGHGSGRGTTAGRGQKGQKARSGVSGLRRLGMRRMMLATPKARGFTGPRPRLASVNLALLEAEFPPQAVVTPRSLAQKRLIASPKSGVKILGDGMITKPLTVKGCSVSKSAAEKILAAGGRVSAEV